MKAENYFPADRADEISSGWMEKLDRKRKWTDGLGRSALMVLDMQRYFMEPAFGAFLPASVTALEKILYVIERFDGPIIFSRHFNSRKDDRNLMGRWWRNLIEGRASEITPSLDSSKGTVIEKSHYSAFMETGLQDLLDGMDIESVIISGLMTDLCCETTARDAFMRGFKVVFLADCTATETEMRHLSTLNVISRAFGEVLTSREFLLR
jgi:nicotinamidase-related amidase